MKKDRIKMKGCKVNVLRQQKMLQSPFMPLSTIKQWDVTSYNL